MPMTTAMVITSLKAFLLCVNLRIGLLGAGWSATRTLRIGRIRSVMVASIAIVYNLQIEDKCVSGINQTKKANAEKNFIGGEKAEIFCRRFGACKYRSNRECCDSD